MKTNRCLMICLLICAVFLLPGLTLADDDLGQVRQAIRDAGAQRTAGPAYFTPEDLKIRLGVDKPIDVLQQFVP